MKLFCFEQISYAEYPLPLINSLLEASGCALLRCSNYKDVGGFDASCLNLFSSLSTFCFQEQHLIHVDIASEFEVILCSRK
jgi:hypothetical protein